VPKVFSYAIMVFISKETFIPASNISLFIVIKKKAKI